MNRHLVSLKAACDVLQIEVPDRNLPAADRESLLKAIKRRYRALLKTAHPDKTGENGFGDACKQTTVICEAFKRLQEFLKRRPFTIAEFYANWGEKKRRERKPPKFDSHRCPVTGRFR